MCLLEPPHVRARSHLRTPEPAVEHRPARHHDRRQVDAGRGHEHGRGGLIAAREQDDGVERVSPQEFFHLHGHEVAEQHRGRPHQRLAKRHGGKLKREAARLPDAALDRVSYPAQVRVAWRELRPAVRYSDDWAAVEYLGRESLRPEPGAVDHASPAPRAEPSPASQRVYRRGGVRSFSHRSSVKARRITMPSAYELTTIPAA